MTSIDQAEQTALITGGSRGIGYELAKLCAQDGYDVVLVSRHQERLQRVADELESTWGITTMTLSKDLSRHESAQEIYDEVERKDIRVDILVNNAAAGPTPDRFDETDIEAVSDLIQINVVSLTHLTRLFVAPMVERGAGRILNVSSAAGEIPNPTFGVYAATKGYVSTLSTVLARQLEPPESRSQCWFRDGQTRTWPRRLSKRWISTQRPKKFCHQRKWPKRGTMVF